MNSFNASSPGHDPHPGGGTWLDGPRPHACRVTRIENATHDIRIVELMPLGRRPIGYRAGQYARIAFGDCPPRDYSIASRPDEPALEFHVRHMASGGASAYVARELRLGDVAWLQGPFGDAWWREDHRGPILAIAGGSGLALMKSIVETALAAGTDQPVHLYFGVGDECNVYLDAHFRTLARRHPCLRFVTVLSDPQQPTRRRTGTVAEAVAADLSSLAGFKAYVAGPPEMVEASVRLVSQLGLPAADIHADPFYSEAERLARQHRG